MTTDSKIPAAIKLLDAGAIARKHVVVGSVGHGICLFLLGSFCQAEATADVGRAGNHGGHSIGHDTDRERVRDRVGKCSVNGI